MSGMSAHWAHVPGEKSLPPPSALCNNAASSAHGAPTSWHHATPSLLEFRKPRATPQTRSKQQTPSVSNQAVTSRKVLYTPCTQHCEWDTSSFSRFKKPFERVTLVFLGFLAKHADAAENGPRGHS
eukprot:4731702-Amphidinium_carterae.2